MEENSTIPKLRDLPDVLTVPEVARVLRVSHAQVRKLIHQGNLPTLDTGGRQLVANETLSRWLAAGRGAEPKATGTVTGPVAVRKGRR